MKQPRPGPLERIKDLCSEAVCTKCGMIGADVRPNWQPLQSHPLGHPERLLDSLPRLGSSGGREPLLTARARYWAVRLSFGSHETPTPRPSRAPATERAG